MEWTFRLGYLFAFIWALGLSTNGTLRNKIIITGALGTIITVVLSILVSIVNKNLLFIGVILESTLVFFISLVILSYLFRHIPKPPINEKIPTVDDLLKK